MSVLILIHLALRLLQLRLRASIIAANYGSGETDVMFIQRRSPKLALLFIGIILSGCAQTTAFYRSESVRPRTSEVRVLLLPPDIELSELTAGGLLEPNAEWTAAAIAHVTTALKQELREKNASIVAYQPPPKGSAKEHSYNQLLKLHGAVGRTILTHHYPSEGLVSFELPSKQGKFDWSLGRDVNVLREEYDTDYALFIYLRDSYATAGRVVLIVAAAFLGIGVPAGQQVGFASLVDLQSGDILWFNRLISPVGDLRTAEPARKGVKNLLADLPL